MLKRQLRQGRKENVTNKIEGDRDFQTVLEFTEFMNSSKGKILGFRFTVGVGY